MLNPADLLSSLGGVLGGGNRNATNSTSSATNSTALSFAPTIISSQGGFDGNVSPSYPGYVSGSPSSSASGTSSAAGSNGTPEAALENWPFGATTSTPVRYDVDGLPVYRNSTATGTAATQDDGSMIMLVGLGFLAMLMLRD